MWFLGHFALGYLVAQLISKFSREKLNLPLIFIFSLLPDFDIFIPELLHRSVTHSVILAILLFVPIFLIAKRGLPYFGALASHTLIGDYITGTSFQLFWPVSTIYFESSYPLRVYGVSEFLVEVGLFIILSYFLFQKAHKKRQNDGNTVRIIGFEF
jgi:membrane-bound metal-dependent hydrolase YbcI (DUF457 family)